MIGQGGEAVKQAEDLKGLAAVANSEEGRKV
jgi:hypothetical protein